MMPVINAISEWFNKLHPICFRELEAIGDLDNYRYYLYKCSKCDSRVLDICRGGGPNAPTTRVLSKDQIAAMIKSVYINWRYFQND